jgi:hypothetical protein
LFIVSFHSRTLDFSPFFSDFSELFVAVRDQSAADQPNYLAEGQPVVTVVIITEKTSQKKRQLKTGGSCIEDLHATFHTSSFCKSLSHHTPIYSKRWQVARLCH